jgi:Arc/MetJ family transcription regulator
MKTTVDIPEDVLAEAMRFAGAKTKREAIVTAIEDYNRRKRMAELIQYSGTSETLLSNEAIEDLERVRTRRLEKRRKS